MLKYTGSVVTLYARQRRLWCISDSCFCGLQCKLHIPSLYVAVLTKMSTDVTENFKERVADQRPKEVTEKICVTANPSNQLLTRKQNEIVGMPSTSPSAAQAESQNVASFSVNSILHRTNNSETNNFSAKSTLATSTSHSITAAAPRLLPGKCVF